MGMEQGACLVVPSVFVPTLTVLYIKHVNQIDMPQFYRIKMEFFWEISSDGPALFKL